MSGITTFLVVAGLQRPINIHNCLRTRDRECRSEKLPLRATDPLHNLACNSSSCSNSSNRSIRSKTQISNTAYNRGQNKTMVLTLRGG